MRWPGSGRVKPLPASHPKSPPPAWSQAQVWLQSRPHGLSRVRSALTSAFKHGLPSAFAFLLYYRVLALAGLGNLALVTLTAAPVAIILGAVTLGEALPLNAYAGFGILAVGLLILSGRLRLPVKRPWPRARPGPAPHAPTGPSSTPSPRAGGTGRPKHPKPPPRYALARRPFQ